jgi:hypothetical protein
MVQATMVTEYEESDKYTLDWGKEKEVELQFTQKSTKWSNDESNNNLLQVKRVLPSMAEMLDKVSNDNNHIESYNNGSNWEVEGYKAIKREQIQTYKETSKYFLPVNMPLFVSEIMVPSKTHLVIPVTITIKQSKEGIHNLKKPRLLVAMMKILQTAYQDTYIGPIGKNSKLGLIAHHQQVPLENKNLMNYMMDPVQGSNNNFSTKIIIHANHELEDYLVTPQFRSYTDNNQSQ